MKIEDLKPGDIFYDVDFYRTIKYEYLCTYPYGKSHYHIILNRNKEVPERIYTTSLKKILALDIRTYEDAKLKHIESIEKALQFLKNQQDSYESNT